MLSKFTYSVMKAAAQLNCKLKINQATWNPKKNKFVTRDRSVVQTMLCYQIFMRACTLIYLLCYYFLMRPPINSWNFAATSTVGLVLMMNTSTYYFTLTNPKLIAQAVNQNLGFLGVPPRVITYRSFKNVDWDAFEKDIAAKNKNFSTNSIVNACISNNTYLYSLNEVDCKTVNLEAELSDLNKAVICTLDEYAPVKRMIVKGKSMPWYNSELRKLA